MAITALSQSNLLLRIRCFRFRFDCDFDFSALFQAHRITLCILQRVLHPNLPVKVFSAFHGNLRLFRQTGMRRRNDLFNDSRKSDGWLLCFAFVILGFVVSSNALLLLSGF